MSRQLLRMLGRWVIGGLLLAQFAIAAYACPSLAAAVADVEPAVAAGFDIVDHGVDGCADAVGAGDPAFANLCAEHCKTGQQSDHSASIAVPAPLPAMLYRHLPSPHPVIAKRCSAASVSALVAASPPHAIAHCVRRT